MENIAAPITKEEAKAEFYRALEAARAEYGRDQAAAWAKYTRAEEAARAEYKRVEAAAWAKE